MVGGTGVYCTGVYHIWRSPARTANTCVSVVRAGELLRECSVRYFVLDALAHSAGATCQADGACANDFANTVRLQNIQQCVELLLRTGCLNDNRLRGNVNHGCTEQVSCLNDLQASNCIGLDLNQDVTTLGGGVGGKLDDLQHVNKLVQLLGDLLDGVSVTSVTTVMRETPGFRVGAHSQGEDVEQSAGEQTGDAGENARP